MPRSRRRCGSHSGLARCPGSEVRCQSRGRFGEAGKARRRGIVGAIPRRSNAASVVETPPNLVTDFGFGTLVAAHLAQLVALVGPQRDHLSAPALERALLPHTEPTPEIVGIEPEDVADVLEGEEPALVGILDPLLGLVEELLAAGVLRPGLLAVHVDRVLEHGDHETALAVMLAAPADPIEELRRQQGVGLEEPGQPVVGGVFTVLHLSLPYPPIYYLRARKIAAISYSCALDAPGADAFRGASAPGGIRGRLTSAIVVLSNNSMTP